MIQSFQTLALTLSLWPRKQLTFFIGVDGPGGAGKSVFAASLCGALAGLGHSATLIPMDDFFRSASERSSRKVRKDEIGADFDWERLLEQALLPLTKNKKARYRRYDWASGKLRGWRTVSAGGFVVVEGVYALRPTIEPVYDYKIWIDCSRKIRLERGLARDGPASREVWERDWMPKEDRYISVHRPHERANLVVDGSGKIPHDVDREFVSIRQKRRKRRAKE